MLQKRVDLFEAPEELVDAEILVFSCTEEDLQDLGLLVEIFALEFIKVGHVHVFDA